MHESVILTIAVITGLVVLGVSWLVYLANGGAPFHVSFRGLGIAVDIARPESAKEKKLDTGDIA